MIRYLNLANQITEGINSFAFYSTISDTILTFDNEQVFDSIEDFTDCFTRNKVVDPFGIDRFIALIPETYDNTETTTITVKKGEETNKLKVLRDLAPKLPHLFDKELIGPFDVPSLLFSTKKTRSICDFTATLIITRREQ